MKKKNLLSLKLRKNKISNLNRLTQLVGGTEGNTGDDNALNTGPTYCATMCPDDCATEADITTCVTNDTRKTVQPPSLQVACNGIDSVDC